MSVVDARRPTVPGGSRRGAKVGRPARRRCAAILVAAAWLAGAAAAAEPSSVPAVAQRDDIAAEREDIAAQRATIEKRYAERERECQQRFVVTSCFNDARQKRRSALTPLREEELRIDTLVRKRKAAVRLEEIEAKQRGDADRDAAAAASLASAPARGSEAAREPPGPAKPILGPTTGRSVDPVERQQREARNQARFDEQQQQAIRHRAEVEARNADRAAKGKAARPLPPPAGASGP